MVRLEVDLASLQFRSATATGSIWLSIPGASAFPSHGWDDFVVVVLGWWMDALLALRRSPETQIVDFMDGPFTVVLNRLGERLTLSGMTGSDRRTLLVQGEANLDDFLDQTRKTSTAVLEACVEAGWWSNDAERLSGLITPLS